MRYGRSYGVERSVHEGTHEKVRRGRGPTLGRQESGTRYLDEHLYEDTIDQFTGDYSRDYSQSNGHNNNHQSRMQLSIPSFKYKRMSMSPGKFLFWIVIAVEIYVLVSILSVMLTSTKVVDMYDKISGQNTSGNFNKKLAFVSALVNTTGNADYALSIGFTKEEAEQMVRSNAFQTGFTDPVSGDPVTPPQDPVPPSITETDITGLAKLVCQSYLVEGSGHYVSSSGDSFAYTPYDTITYNQISMPPYTLGTPTYYARCCNGLSSALLRLCGVTTYNDGSNISSSWPYVGCEDFLNKVGTLVPVTKAGDLEVGDIICVKRNGRSCGHVETVVKKDAQFVYIASAGSSDGISDCANVGYRRKFEYDKDLTTYYTSQTSSSWQGLAGVKRP